MPKSIPARNLRPSLPPADPSTWGHTAPPFSFIRPVKDDPNQFHVTLRQASGPGFGTGTAIVRADEIPQDGDLTGIRWSVEWAFFPSDFRTYSYVTEKWRLEELKKHRGELRNSFILELASNEAVLRGRIPPMARLLTLDGRTAVMWRELDALAFKLPMSPRHRGYWMSFMGRMPDHNVWVTKRRERSGAAKAQAAAAARAVRFAAAPQPVGEGQREHHERRRHGLRHAVLDGLVVDGHTASASDLKQLLGL